MRGGAPRATPSWSNDAALTCLRPRIRVKVFTLGGGHRDGRRGASGATLEDIGWEVCVVTDQGDHARPTLPRLEHGSVFAGYWIDRLLDRGGMGVVYKAMDIDLDRAVALKLIAPEWMEDENATARFRTEARLAASLEHPNIVPVHRGGEEQGVLYLAMRFVPGTNLRRMIDRSPLPVRDDGRHPDPDRRARSTPRTRADWSIATSSRRTS